MDLLRVRVLDRPAADRIRLRVELTPAEAAFCVAKGFVLMLTEGAVTPTEHGPACFVGGSQVDLAAWRRVQEAMETWEEAGHDYRDVIASVEIVEWGGYPRAAPPHPEEPPPWAVYEVTSAIQGIFDHLPVGLSWGSTAFDELETGEVFEG
jgi:hypothetical protein